MSLNIDEDGNIYIYQGDSGEIILSGLPTDKNYTVYFMVKDVNKKTVANRLEVQTNFSSTVTFFISSEFSELLTIPNNEEVGFYYYGLKTVDENGMENTLFVEGECYGSQTKIIVFPQKVEV